MANEYPSAFFVLLPVATLPFRDHFCWITSQSFHSQSPAALALPFQLST
jgi:hypothetical protein